MFILSRFFKMYTIGKKIAITIWYIENENTEKLLERFAFAYPQGPVPSKQTVLNIFNILSSEDFFKN